MCDTVGNNEWDLDWEDICKPLKELAECSICPRECKADRRTTRLGYCRSGTEFAISSIFAHMGEEPVLSGKRGICNIFFDHCNMQCVFCQNYQISRVTAGSDLPPPQLPDVIAEIEDVLARGARGVGFVSPSHYIPQMKVIIGTLKARGHRQPFVFNTNGYDQVSRIKSLEGMIDVYLPDLKYMDERLAREYSDTKNYPNIATAALKEMFHQKGANIFLDDDGVIESGLIIRHLVLPGHVENSKAVLRFIADELSPAVHISLMAQYHPTIHVRGHPVLDRTLKAEEYEEVLEEFERLGFYRGWVQALDSPSHYLPDFTEDQPFQS